MASRFVGLWIKLFTILTCFVVAALFTAFAGLAIVFWLGYPVFIIILAIFGFKLMFGV